jgi:hypothetical protein
MNNEDFKTILPYLQVNDGSPRPVMECGCMGQGDWVGPDGKRYYACVVHDLPQSAMVRLEQPDLSGRRAECSYYPHGGKYGKCPLDYGRKDALEGRPPSSTSLPFFKYRGPGYNKNHCANCGAIYTHHYKMENDREKFDKLHLNKTYKDKLEACPGFEPDLHGEQYDEYYCGCWGWD